MQPAGGEDLSQSTVETIERFWKRPKFHGAAPQLVFDNTRKAGFMISDRVRSWITCDLHCSRGKMQFLGGRIDGFGFSVILGELKCLKHY